MVRILLTQHVVVGEINAELPEDLIQGDIPQTSEAGSAPGRSWKVEEQVIHASFGVGEITHTFGSGEKVSIALRLAWTAPKVLDQRLAPIEPLDDADG